MIVDIFSRRNLTLPLIIVLFAMVGCAPKIRIAHQDPTHKIVLITVDNGKTKTLEYEDDMKVRVSRGVHVVDAKPKGSKTCPWTSDGKGWTIWVDKDSSLVLLPPVKTDTPAVKKEGQ